VHESGNSLWFSASSPHFLDAKICLSRPQIRHFRAGTALAAENGRDLAPCLSLSRHYRRRHIVVLHVVATTQRRSAVVSMFNHYLNEYVPPLSETSLPLRREVCTQLTSCRASEYSMHTNRPCPPSACPYTLYNSHICSNANRHLLRTTSQAR
jgi:hypothetical protein